MDLRDPRPVAVLGVPFDEASSFLKGAGEAPFAIREALNSPSSNMCAENGLDLGRKQGWIDVGDVVFDGNEEPNRVIEDSVASLLERGHRVVCLGGDHSITYPVLRAYARTGPLATAVHLDAHPDLYDELDGNRFSHACPFARIMEEGLVERLVQVGIRTANPHQREQAERFGVETVEAARWPGDANLGLDGPVYVSFDLDVLDPAFAPGVSHHEPGGLSTRDVIGIVQRLGASVIGADIVELNPRRDVNGVTAMVAAKLLKEILATMLQ